MRIVSACLSVLPKLILALVAISPLSTTFGGVVVSTLAAPNNGTNTINYNSWAGDSFITNNAAWRLNSVTFDMVAGTSSSGSGTYFVAVYSDSGSNKPGSALATLSGSTNPYTAGLSSYTAAGSGLLLAPNTRYWLVQGLTSSVSTGGGAYKTRYTNSASSASGIWTVPGTNTSALVTPGYTWDTFNGYPSKFEISATSAVPEPSTWALGLIVSGITAITARRRIKRSAA